MLNIFEETGAVLVATMERLAAYLRDLRDHRKERAVLTRLLGEDDYRLRDIGLTPHDIVTMLRRDWRGASVHDRPVSWSQGALTRH